MQVHPYLTFEGRCEEAIEFYRSVVGAEVEMLMRFKDAPSGDQAMTPPDMGDKVMHATLRIGDSTVMVSDGRCSGKSGFTGISLSLTADSEAEATRLFQALEAGGHIAMPIGKTFFAAQFGMVADRFGVMWMVLCM